MRRTTVLLTAVAAVVLALPVRASAAPSVDKAAPAGPVLTSVTLSTGAVKVNGLDTVPVTVTVTASGDFTGTGMCPGSAGGVELDRVSGRAWDRSAPAALLGAMSCVSENAGVRTYRAAVPVPSSGDGSWRVRYVEFANYYFFDPRDFDLPDATVTVSGTHRPRLRVNVRPQPLAYPARDVTVTVRATYDDGSPLTNRWIGVTDDAGGIGACGSCPGNTDAHGRLVRRLHLTDFRQVVAFMPLSAPGFYDEVPMSSLLWTPIVVQPALSAAPARSSVPHGANVGVAGRVVAVAVQNWPIKPRITVGLQRLVGRHWRTVSESTVRGNGRFTLVATPPKGRNLYRVGFPTQQTFGSATSATFVIRGT